MIAAGSGGAIGGGGLTATGVGAIGGVPLIGASGALVIAGVGVAGIGAAGLAGSALGDSRVEPWRAADRGDHRDVGGRYADGNPGTSGKAEQKKALDRVEKAQGVTVIRDDVKATVPGGRETGRHFDGLVRKSDGTWEGIEVKSGTSRDREQEKFDALISYDNPGRARLKSGEEIIITSMRKINV